MDWRRIYEERHEKHLRNKAHYHKNSVLQPIKNIMLKNVTRNIMYHGVFRKFFIINVLTLSRVTAFSFQT